MPRQNGQTQDNCPAGDGPGAWAETVAAHKDRTRARILDAAAALIADRGASELAMTTLARRAGIARATLYNYFPDAERVLAALVEAEVTAFLHDLDHRLATVTDPRERLDATVDQLVSWVARQASRRPVRGADAGSRGGARSVDVAGIHRSLAAIEDRTGRVIAAARDARVLPSHTDPALAARFVVALAFGIRGQLAGTGSDRTATALREFLLAGLGAAGPASLPAGTLSWCIETPACAIPRWRFRCRGCATTRRTGARRTGPWRSAPPASRLPAWWNCCSPC